MTIKRSGRQPAPTFACSLRVSIEPRFRLVIQGLCFQLLFLRKLDLPYALNHIHVAVRINVRGIPLGLLPNCRRIFVSGADIRFGRAMFVSVASAASEPFTLQKEFRHPQKGFWANRANGAIRYRTRSVWWGVGALAALTKTPNQDAALTFGWIDGVFLHH